MYEPLDLTGTLGLVRTLQPEITTVLVVASESAPGGPISTRIAAQMTTGPTGMDVRRSAATNIGELEREVSRLPKRSAVVIGTFHDLSVSEQELFHRLAALPRPVYGLYYTQMRGLEYVGGRVVLADKQGQVAGAIAVRVLGGEKPEDIAPDRTSALDTVVMWPSLERWGISGERVPKDALVLQAPEPSAHRMRSLVAWISAALVSQAVAIGVILWRFSSLRREEARLTRIRGRYELALEAGSGIVWDWDIATDRTVWSGSEKTLQLLGFTMTGEPDVRDDRWEKRVHPDDLERVRAALKAHLEQDEPYDVEYRVRTAEGEYRWFRSRGACVREAGKPVRMAGAMIDTTEAHETRTKVEQSEARFRAVFHGNAVPMWIYDQRTLRIVEVNQAAIDHYGYDRARFVGLDIRELRPREERGAFEAFLANRSAVQRSFGRWRHQTRDGRVIDVDVNSHMVPGLEGAPMRLVSARDVTALVASQRLIEREARLFLDGPAVAWRWRCAPGWPVEHVSANVRSFGYEPERFTSGELEYASIIHPDDRERVEREASELAGRSATDFDQEYRIKAADGSWRWVSARMVVEFDRAGAPVRFVGYTIDITSRRESEERLRAVQVTNRALLDAIPDLMFRVDRDGRYLDYHAPPDMNLMAPPEVFLGRTVRESIPAKYAELCMAHLERLFQTGEAQSYEYEVEVEGERRSFEVRMVRLRWTPGPVGPQAEDQAMLLIRNISDRKRAERALRESQERLSLLIRRTPLGVIIWDPEFRVREWNPGAEAIFGYTAAEASGRGPEFLLAPELMPMVRDVFSRLMERKGGLYSRNQNLHKDGRVITCEWTNSPLVDDDNRVVGVACIVQDVTAEIMAETRQRRLVAELDHRVKNNLASVLTIAEMTGRASTNYREFLGAFGARLRAMARTHGALAQARWSGVGLRQVIEQNLEPYTGMHPTEQVVVAMDEDMLLPPRAAQALATTFDELATNAAKYGALLNPDGRLSISWTIQRPPETEFPVIELRWVERVSRPLTNLAPQSGLGGQLIDGAIAFELGGTVKRTFAPEGLTVLIRAPIKPEEDPSIESVLG